MSILIVGCGYVGCEFARQWLAPSNLDSDRKLYALTRSADRQSELLSLGVTPIVGDWLDENSLPDLPNVRGVLVAVPHRPDERLGSESHVVGLGNLLNRLGVSSSSATDAVGNSPHLVYLSTTGVYGQVEAEEVDESTPVSPTRAGPELAVQAEKWLQARHSAGELPQLTILRLAGIYGPGRIPLIQSLKAGEPLAVPRDGHLNLIHVVDIGRLLVRIFQKPPQASLYVASDGQPVLRGAFYSELARLCGVTEPQFVSPAEDDRRVRRATDKRVNPARLFADLELNPLFADYRSGLAQVIEQDKSAD